MLKSSLFACYRVEATSDSSEGYSCQDFKDGGIAGTNYDKYCYESKIDSQQFCIGNTEVGGIESVVECTDVDKGIQFLFEEADFEPMHFNKGGEAICQNYHPYYLEHLAWSLGYGEYRVDVKKPGGICNLVWLDGNGKLQTINKTNGGLEKPYKITFWGPVADPTCDDGKQNQGESGVDCGGPCPTCVWTQVCDTCWCGTNPWNRELLGIFSFEECKQKCVEGIDCNAVEYWEGNSYCYKCINEYDNSQFNFKDDDGYPPHVYHEVPDRCVRSLNPCLNGAECYNDESYEGGVRCECAAGWTGNTCADAEDKCDPNPCQNGGECEDGICYCPETCRGSKCETCITDFCDDGILNEWEEKTDCGGPCDACPTCEDGIKNQEETGVDCGGPCTKPCQDACEKFNGIFGIRSDKAVCCNKKCPQCGGNGCAKWKDDKGKKLGSNQCCKWKIIRRGKKCSSDGGEAPCML